jgi:hypothetical protein
LLKKIVYAGSNTPSFQRAAEDLLVLAEVKVPVKQVQRLTEQIGQERIAEREAAMAAWLARPLAQRQTPPSEVTAPQLAVVEMDGGRLQIRPSKEEAEATDEGDAGTLQGPSPAAEPARASVADVPAAAATASNGAADRQTRSKHWREDKVGCLLAMTSDVSLVDPCPEIPAVFVDPLRSLKLAQEIGRSVVPPGAPFQRTEAEGEEGGEEEGRQRPGQAEVVSRRVVATRKDVSQFGPLLAAAAWSMGLFSALRQAFVADGLSENWSVHKRYFSRWTAVLDFVHALTYVYKAAMAGRTFVEGWPVYERWIRWVWSGQVGEVIKELRRRQQELGAATKEEQEGSPRRVVQEALTYLSNNQDKMRYDEYRKQGLPLMSSHVESTVKQINYRVKGTEKFWAEEGAEALLQLRADYLSDDEPMEAFWERRQAGATGQRRYRRSA